MKTPAGISSNAKIVLMALNHFDNWIGAVNPNFDALYYVVTIGSGMPATGTVTFMHLGHYKYWPE